LNPALQRCNDRWYPLRDHPVQRALVEDDVRFKVAVCGRRSGKSEKTKRMMVKKAISKPNQKLGIAAPTLQQVRQIFWHDLKLLSYYPALDPGAVRESDMSITYPNGSVIQLIGLDRPERMEGVAWSGMAFDELDSVKNIMQAWGENISPALDTVNPQDPDYRPWAILIGTPDGMELLYDRYEYARTANDPDWAAYHWTSEEILPTDVIEAAKKRMSATQYRQEYLGSFETTSGKIYADYSEKNLTTETIQDHEQLYWAHDFNYTPMSSCICVQRGEAIYILDEIILTSAIARQTALEFVDRYKNHGNKNLCLFGDPSGRAGEKHGQASNYTEIEKVLRASGWTVKRLVKDKAPAIRDRQNAVRAKIKNAADEVSLYVNAQKAPYSNRGLSTVTVKEGSTFLEDDRSEYQHVTTAIGYMVDRLWPIKPDKQEIKFIPQPTKHYWNDLSR